jgi:hypothetical protein
MKLRKEAEYSMQLFMCDACDTLASVETTQGMTIIVSPCKCQTNPVE